MNQPYKNFVFECVQWNECILAPLPEWVVICQEYRISEKMREDYVFNSHLISETPYVRDGTRVALGSHSRGQK